MVALHIISESEEIAKKIVTFLIKEKMIFEATLLSNSETIISKELEPEIKKSTLIVALTKALLFKTINAELKKNFHNEKLTVYSLPVIDMDLKKQKALIEHTRSV
jgi:hypothetical protein